MAYYNGGGGYNRGNNYRAGYQDRNGNLYEGPRPQRKKSGAKKGTSRSGRPYISGFNKRRGSYTTFICFPYKDTQETTSDSGKRWQNWIIKYSVNNGPDALDTCLLNMETGRIHWQKRGWIINPNKNYAGRNKRRDNR